MTEPLSFEKSRRSAGGPRLPDAGVTAPEPSQVLAPDLMRAVVAFAAGRTRLEASGGLLLSNAREVAETGVDYLAVGALTHSAPALDIGLDIEEAPR